MTIHNTPINVALVDDHILLRTALSTMINSFENFHVVVQASTGAELIEQLQNGILPDVVLLDLSMPVMNGQQTAVWLSENHPSVQILLLSEYDSELTLIRLLQLGVRGFLRKDVHPSELRFALQSVVHSGYYYSNHTTGRIVNMFRSGQSGNMNLQKAMLSDQEIQFLQLACSDKTYKEVAAVMKLNVRTVDTIRDQLFIKLDVKSRVGLVLTAIRHGIHTY